MFDKTDSRAAPAGLPARPRSLFMTFPVDLFTRRISIGTKAVMGLAIALIVVSAVLTAVEYRVTSRTLATGWEVKSLDLARLLASTFEPLIERGDMQSVMKILRRTTLGIETRSVAIIDREGRLLANSFNQRPGQPVSLPPERLEQVLNGEVVSWIERAPSTTTRFILAPLRGKPAGSSGTSRLKRETPAAAPMVMGAVLIEMDQSFIQSLVDEHLRSLLFVNGITFTTLLIMLWMVIRISLVQPLSELTQTARGDSGLQAGRRRATGSVRTLTERFTHVTEALHTSEALNQAVLDSLPIQIAVLDRNGTVIAVNAAWSHFAKESGNPMACQTGTGVNYLNACREISGAFMDTAREALAGIQAVLDGTRRHFTLEYPCETPTGPRWCLLTATPLTRAEGGAVVSHQDITERKGAEEIIRQSEAHFHAVAASQKQTLEEQEQHLKELTAKNRELDQMAIRDPLTGLYNRRFFDEALAREWRRFQRTGEAFTVIIMDVDAFKHINDEHGHEAGDQALQLVGTALRSTLRESDLTARVGGDEFAAVLPGTDMEHSGPVIEKLSEAVGKLRLTGEAAQIPISLSVGTATVPGFPPVNSAAELLRVADKRMYEAKRRSSGKTDAR
ncbi:MAG TPA: diguanylate cyclase [Nitrospiraceae bacterium]|jgi:diguanylate cyclase (GGDEF)-like protein|nr:diguanylate cyclase [Nitrospiraceae bacterium]